MSHALSMIAGAACSVFLLWWLHVPEQPVDTKKVYAEAYAQGRKDALNTRDVSMDLEYACVNLWFGKEGSLYYEMRKEHEERKKLK